MRFDMVIKGGTVVAEGGTGQKNIGIRDGRIAAFPEGDGWEAGEVLDAAGCYVLPGAIDTHTHFFEPGAEYREDFAHGTRAAASGGFTCIMEMPNSNPAAVDRDTFLLKKELAGRGAVVDYALWAGATAGNLGHLEELKELGCIAFKAFTLDAGPAFPYLNTEMQMEAMEKIRGLNRVFGFHAEEPAVVGELKKRYGSLPWTLSLHEKARPYYAELAAVGQIILFARETGCPVHICHLSIPEGAKMIAKAKEDGVNITAESCSHYFLLNVEDAGKYGTYALIQPPLRSRERMEAMWGCLFGGMVDYLGTDHAPYTEADKEPEDGNLWDVAGGAPSIDVAFPLMFEEAVLKRGMDPVRFAALASGNAAKRFGIYPRKGCIRAGADADIAVLDPDSPWAIDRGQSFSKTRCTKFPYQGRQLNCRVKYTVVRGKTVFCQGRITAESGYGRFVRPDKD